MLGGGTGSGWPGRSCAKIGGAIAESKPKVKKRLVSRFIFVPSKDEAASGSYCRQTRE